MIRASIDSGKNGEKKVKDDQNQTKKIPKLFISVQMKKPIVEKQEIDIPKIQFNL